MTDKFLIVLDEDIKDDYVLAVLSAIQGLETNYEEKIIGWNSIYNEKREFELSISLVADARISWLFKDSLKYISEIDYKPRFDAADFNCVCHLSYREALNICKTNPRPLAQAFALLLGTDTNSLADVSKIECDCDEDFSGEWLSTNIMLSGSRVDDPTNLYYLMGAIKDCKGFIDYAGFGTYYASCLKKPVIEIGTPSFLFKWSNPNYRSFDKYDDEKVKQCLRLMDV